MPAPLPKMTSTASHLQDQIRAVLARALAQVKDAAALAELDIVRRESLVLWVEENDKIVVPERGRKSA